MPADYWQTLRLTLALAACTTALLLVLGLPLAYALAGWRSRLMSLAYRCSSAKGLAR